VGTETGARPACCSRPAFERQEDTWPLARCLSLSKAIRYRIDDQRPHDCCRGTLLPPSPDTGRGAPHLPDRLVLPQPLIDNLAQRVVLRPGQKLDGEQVGLAQCTRLSSGGAPKRVLRCEATSSGIDGVASGWSRRHRRSSAAVPLPTILAEPPCREDSADGQGWRDNPHLNWTGNPICAWPAPRKRAPQRPPCAESGHSLTVLVKGMTTAAFEVFFNNLAVKQEGENE
jgi:hypothetical protein